LLTGGAKREGLRRDANERREAVLQHDFAASCQVRADRGAERAVGGREIFQRDPLGFGESRAEHRRQQEQSAVGNPFALRVSATSAWQISSSVSPALAPSGSVNEMWPSR
jgi:hypothetical protein